MVLFSDNSNEFSLKLIAIIGAGIGGCSASYFLEEYFSGSNKELVIDLFDKSSQIGGRNSIIKYNGFEYSMCLDYVEFTPSYIDKFSELTSISQAQLPFYLKFNSHLFV